eukprot:sb/3466043/
MAILNGPCLLGDCPYIWEESSNPQESILKHLLETHKVVVANVNTVYDLAGYCKYWRFKVTEDFKHYSQSTGTIGQFLHGFSVKPTADSSVDKQEGMFYMLNDTTNEDISLRHRLFAETQRKVLNQQQVERNRDDFKIKCLFCPETISGTRFTLSEHLYDQHSFTLGHPDNLVYTEEFIERLRAKMTRAECLYCDKVFRDYKILREHMRKKLHKKVNPANTESADEEWDDWKDSVPEIKCLACSVSYKRLSDIKSHMNIIHHLDFEKLTANLSFYKQIKLVNFLRYRLDANRCPFCSITPDDNLSEHLFEHKHTQNVPPELYEDEQYLFPALENDYLLCCLRDEGGEQEEVVVIPEDISR